MRTVVLCLNFPAWCSRSARSEQGNKARGTKMLAGDATIGKGEIGKGLKTPTEIWGRGGGGTRGFWLEENGFENPWVIAPRAVPAGEGGVLLFYESTGNSALSFPSRPLLNPWT